MFESAKWSHVFSYTERGHIHRHFDATHWAAIFHFAQVTRIVARTQRQMHFWRSRHVLLRTLALIPSQMHTYICSYPPTAAKYTRSLERTPSNPFDRFTSLNISSDANFAMQLVSSLFFLIVVKARTSQNFHRFQNSNCPFETVFITNVGKQ